MTSSLRVLALLLFAAGIAGAATPDRPRHSPPSRENYWDKKKDAVPAPDRKQELPGAELTAPALPAPEKTPAKPTEQSEPAKKTDPVGLVERATMKVMIKTEGTVRAEDIFRLKSQIEGRVEQVFARPERWFEQGKPLVKILEKEYAALMDAKASTPYAIMEDRWQAVYKATPATCAAPCYVLKVYAVPKRIVKPQTLLVEAARKLRLIGRVRAGDSRWVQKGQVLTFWPREDPGHKLQGRIENFTLDTQGERLEPAGSFSVLLSPKRFLKPDTEWEGAIEVLVKKKVLRVPTSALLNYKGETYLAVRVSTGITTYEHTEITAGVSERDQYMVIDEAKRGELPAHEPPPAYLGEAPAAEENKPAARRARERELQPESPRRQKKWAPPKIDVFPDDVPEDKDERFPSDL